MICVGTTTLDQVLEIEEMPKQAIKIPALRHAKRGGGPAATAAVACAVLDQPAELWSRMGADSESEFLRERLLHHGVGLSGTLFRSGADTVTAVVIVDRKGERFIVGYGHGSLPRSPEPWRNRATGKVYSTTVPAWAMAWARREGRRSSG